MPHIVVKLFSGRSEDEKVRIADELTKAIIASAHCDEAAVSVGIEDVEPRDWTESVYQPEITGKWATLYKKPGYAPA